MSIPDTPETYCAFIGRFGKELRVSTLAWQEIRFAREQRDELVEALRQIAAVPTEEWVIGAAYAIARRALHKIGSDPNLIGTDNPVNPVCTRRPWRCRIFGHRWRTFGRDWCGVDYQICQRIGFFPLKMCGAVRNIPTAGVA